MAQIALGGNCPVCHTLVACSGNFTDVYLYGQCPVDNTVVQVFNSHQYTAPPGQADANVTASVDPTGVSSSAADAVTDIATETVTTGGDVSAVIG